MYLFIAATPFFDNLDDGTNLLNGWTSLGWTWNTGATGSFGTGPSDDLTGGGSYLYYETSGGGGTGSTSLVSECYDLSTLAAPALSFGYHMYGATTGSLTATVNGDTVWTLSGDQGDQWNIAQVDLAAYAGGDVVIGLYAAYGGSFTGDIGIDNIGLGELQLLGCTDASACNYDASATSDDGSCDYSCLGCTDSLANNYDPTSTIDDGSCVYCTGNWVTVSCDGGSFQGEVSWTL